MNWITFLIYLLTAYLLYYAISLAFDLFLFKSRKMPASSTQDIYRIEELGEPIDVSIIEELDPQEVVLSSGRLISTGAQNYDTLMEEAAKDALEHSAKIPF